MKKKHLPSSSSSSSRRSFIVLSSLVGVLTLTSVLLRAMQGAPLTPDAASSMMVSDSRASLDVIFNTRVQNLPNRWQSIYVHHSKTAGGNVGTLAGSSEQGCGDHFVVGNGDGAIDGEIQFTQRWNLQQPADPAPGSAASKIDATCISICVVGDFDKTAPTPTQLRRLEQLVQTLQERLRIPAGAVWLFDGAESSAAVGRFFPSSAFQGQLLR